MKSLIAICAFFTVISIEAGKPTTTTKLDCFSGTETANPDYQGFGGTCTLLAGSCVYLDTISIQGPQGAFAGVDILPGLPAKPIGAVNKLSFAYTVDAGVVGPLSPRFSIAIDENGDGTTEAYALIGADGCNDPLASEGRVGFNCPVYYRGTVYENWYAFAAAHPSFRIANDSTSFIIADQGFKGTICNIEFGRSALK